MTSLFQRYGLALVVAAAIAGLLTLHAMGRFPRPGILDVSQLAGSPTMVLEGEVADFPSIRWRQTRFTLEGRAVPLSGFSGRTQVTLKFVEPDLMPGDRVRVRGWLSQPREASRQRAFDEKGYWASQNVYSFLRVWDENGLERLSRPRVCIAREAFRFHRAFRDFWEDRLSPDAAALLLGITIGARDGMSKKLKDDCIRAGVYHMVVVSGQNVGVIILALTLIFSTMQFPKHRLLWVAFVPLVFYACVAGSDPPVTRAVVMSIGGLLAAALRRDTLYWYSLVWAAGLLLLVRPAMLFGASFQLSFAATASILWMLPWTEPLLEKIHWSFRWFFRTALFSVGVQIGVWPLLSHYFGTISLVGFIANLMIFPTATLILFYGLGVGVWGVFFPSGVPEFLVLGAAAILQATLGLIHWLARWDFAMIPIAKMSWSMMAAYYTAGFGILWVVHRRFQNDPKPTRIENHWSSL